jgi:hypothetical protein|tara:strand:- start:56 stop:487 length:432 start_codon:yes stop_codon:yes gene_type:complete
MNKRELSKVFSRLAKEEVNLGTHRVELTIIMDIQKYLKSAEGYFNDAIDMENELSEYTSEIEDTKDLLRKSIENAKSEVRYLKTGMKGDVDDIKNRASKAAGELGIDLKDIKGMKELEALIQEGKLYAKNLENQIKFASKEAK